MHMSKSIYDPKIQNGNQNKNPFNSLTNTNTIRILNFKNLRNLSQSTFEDKKASTQKETYRSNYKCKWENSHWYMHSMH